MEMEQQERALRHTFPRPNNALHENETFNATIYHSDSIIQIGEKRRLVRCGRRRKLIQ